MFFSTVNAQMYIYCTCTVYSATIVIQHLITYTYISNNSVEFSIDNDIEI